MAVQKMSVLKYVFLSFIMVVEIKAWTRIFADWTQANTNKVTPMSSTEVALSKRTTQLRMHDTTMSSATTKISKDCFSNTTTTYLGKQNITNSSHTCLRWDSSLIPINERFQDADFPLDGSVQQANNYCRDPNNSGDLWCYITIPEVRIDTCLIDKCETIEENQTASTILAEFEDDVWLCRYPTKDCLDDEQLVCYDKVYTTTIKEDCDLHLCCYKRGCIDLTSSMYAGRWSHTVYLVECLRWDTITVIPLRGSSFPEGSIAAANNYCRDPDRMGLPYCFIKAEVRTYCGIPTCSELASRHKYSHDCYTPTSRDSIGSRRDVTENDLCLLDPDRIVIDSDELRDIYPGCRECSCCQIQKCHMDSSQIYGGTWSRTESGRECKSWALTEYMSYPDFFFFYDNTPWNSENYCRDFFGIGYTSCVTKDLNMGLEKCNLKIECPDLSRTTLKEGFGFFTLFLSKTSTSQVTQETIDQKETTTMKEYSRFDTPTQTVKPTTSTTDVGYSNNLHAYTLNQDVSTPSMDQRSVVSENKTHSVDQASLVYKSKTHSVDQTTELQYVNERKTPSVDQTTELQYINERKTTSVDQTTGLQYVNERKTPSVDQTTGLQYVNERKTPSVDQTTELQYVNERKTPSVDQTSAVYKSKTFALSQATLGPFTETASAPNEEKSISADNITLLTTRVYTWESTVEQNVTEWKPSKAHAKQTAVSALFLIVSLHLF